MKILVLITALLIASPSIAFTDTAAELGSRCAADRSEWFAADAQCKFVYRGGYVRILAMAHAWQGFVTNLELGAAAANLYCFREATIFAMCTSRDRLDKPIGTVITCAAHAETKLWIGGPNGIRVYVVCSPARGAFFELK